MSMTAEEFPVVLWKMTLSDRIRNQRLVQKVTEKASVVSLIIVWNSQQVAFKFKKGRSPYFFTKMLIVIYYRCAFK